MTPLPPKDPPIPQLTATETAPKDHKDAGFFTVSDGFAVQQIDDPDAPAELLPIARSYATEKLSYEVLLFDQLNEPALRPIDGPLDLSTLEQPLGFSQPATGALLTFEQEWVPFGLSLGQLLHSLALAPGEHTHIAAIDWNRREQASRQEDTQQSESLSHEITQRRSISETAEMVKKELQEGHSEVAQQSSAEQNGMAFGASWAGMNLGASASSAQNATLGRAVTSSSGRRDISAHLQSQINSRTQQHAASVRNRRASVITEVQQQEKETLQTRTIANYNHSHALSVHYYEVVQIYRVTTRLKRCERCLFLPMKPLDFDHPRLLQRSRGLLWRYAREPHLRSLLEQYLARKVEMRWLPAPAKEFSFSERSVQLAQRNLTRIRLRSYRRSAILEARLQAHTLSSPQAPASFSFQKDARSETAMVTFEKGFPLEELQQLSLLLVPSQTTQDAFTVELFLGQDTTPFASARLEPLQTESAVWPLLSFKEAETQEGSSREEISALLNEDALYYSQVVWQHLTQTEIAMLLAGYRWEGGALLERIDPQPVAVYGNFVVFRSPLEASSEEESAREGGERQEAWQRWQAWMRKQADFTREEQEFIPVATGGTFAEAVLGRFNASEKLDMTRFWDWQDSPIPLQSTAIQPLASGTRKSEVSPETGKLEAPVVNIVNPPALPNPQGADLLASLNALELEGVFLTIGGMGGVVIGDLWFANALCPLLEKVLMNHPSSMYSLYTSENLFLRFTDPRCPSKRYLQFLLSLKKTDKELRESSERALFSLFPQSDATAALLQQKFLSNPMKGLDSALLAKDLKLLQPHIQTKVKHLLFQWLYQIQQKGPSSELLDVRRYRLEAIRLLLREHPFISDVFFRLFQSFRKKEHFDDSFFDFAITYANFTKSHQVQRKKLIFWIKEKIQEVERGERIYKKKNVQERQDEKRKLLILLVSFGEQMYFPALLRMSELTCEDVGVHPKFCPPRTRPNLESDESTFVETIASLPVLLRKKYVPLIKNFLRALRQMRKEEEMYYAGGYHRDLQRTVITMCENFGAAGKPLLPDLKALHQHGVLYDNELARYYQIKKVIDSIERAVRLQKSKNKP